jgi:peptide/nickel transport system permease protein
MIKEQAFPASTAEEPPRYSEFKRVIRIFFGRKLAAIGFVIVCLIILTAIFAPLLAPHNPYNISLNEMLLQPSQEHLLGTDALGRDTFSRVIYGSRTSLMVGVITVGIAAFIGQSLGAIAAYFGGMVNTFIMRCIDSLMTVPPIMIALVIAAVLGGGLKNVISAIGIGLIAPQARFMCGQVLSIKQNDYILAGRAMGTSDLRMMLRHIVPNAFPPLIVLMTMEIGGAILLEAGLSFLGVGIEAPGAAWGSMVSEGFRYILSNPMVSIAPGVAIMMTVFGFNMMGDGLRDALDPRFRGIL